jgi:hypothetical protein
MATQTTQSSLDELAKGLASGTLSRGKAIRWMGGALLGAALASVPGILGERLQAFGQGM